MRLKSLSPFFLLTFLCLASCNSVFAAEVPWITSYPRAKELARKSGKLMMIDFYTDWCGYCKKLDREVYVVPSVVKLAGNVIPLKVNPEKDSVIASLAQKYGITGFPTILFLSSQGELVGRIGGYLPAEPFKQQMQRYVSLYKEVPKLQARLNANPNDATSASRLVQMYALWGNQERAKTALAKLEKADPGNSSGKLSPAYAALGNMYGASRKISAAEPLFQKALKTAKGPTDTAMGNIGMAMCYLFTNRRSQAKTVLSSIVSNASSPVEYKDRAKQLLTMLEQQSGG